jgi:prepilin-type N-terminal cleavage/methylation domain-containing protein
MKIRSMRRRGFSLVELLVVTAISAIVGGSIVALMIGQIHFSSTHNRNMINEENLRDTLGFMVDEIGGIGNHCEEPFVKQMDTAHIRFVGDFNGDFVWDQGEYYLENGNLMRRLRTSEDNGANWTVISTDQILAGVSSLTFTYYKRGNTAATTLDEITSIGIRIVMNSATDTTAVTGGHVAAREMTSRVTLRNRMM